MDRKKLMRMRKSELIELVINESRKGETDSVKLSKLTKSCLIECLLSSIKRREKEEKEALEGEREITVYMSDPETGEKIIIHVP